MRVGIPVTLPTWPVAAAALGGLLVLVAVSVLTSSRTAQDIYAQIDSLNAHHQHVEEMLRRLRSDLHLSGNYIRDYLLDTENERIPQYRGRLTELRAAHRATLAELRSVSRPEDRARIEGLETKLNDYWETFDPLFDWTVLEKILRSARFLRREVLPRRNAVLAIAQEIEELNNTNLAAQRAEVMKRQVSLRDGLRSLLWRSLLLGLLVAVAAVARLRALERRSNEQRIRAERDELQMRHLSQQLVATQEEERRKLSRELHDQVGQMLTALRMEVGRVERTRPAGDARFGLAIAECKTLVDTMLRSVRDLALGLRPSMLDDFGLEPALEWHVRDFRRRYNIHVDLSLRGDLGALPDQYRTCVYRVVQEALTNCVRHARATKVEVDVCRADGRLEVSIVDDGVGFDAMRRAEGLGLLGIEERVRELHGTCTIRSAPGAGAEVKIVLPLASSVPEAALARAAG
jgi:signal transduction histidine kinase